MFNLNPIAIFPDMTILGKKDELLEIKQTEKSRSLTFKARVNNYNSGKIESYLFIVYDENVDKVMKMKLKSGSKIHIYSEIQQYISNGQIKTNYKVLDIGFSEAAQQTKKGGSPTVSSEPKIDMSKAYVNLDEDFEMFNAQLPDGYEP